MHKVIILIVIWLFTGMICLALYNRGWTEKWYYTGSNAVYIHIPRYPGEKFYLAERDKHFRYKDMIKKFFTNPNVRIFGIAGITGIALAMTLYTLRKSH